MSYSSGRPYQELGLSVKNRKLRLQFAKQSWITEGLRNATWSDISQFLLLHLDERWIHPPLYQQVRVVV